MVGLLADVDTPYVEATFDRDVILFGGGFDSGFGILADETLRVYVSRIESCV